MIRFVFVTLLVLAGAALAKDTAHDMIAIDMSRVDELQAAAHHGSASETAATERSAQAGFRTLSPGDIDFVVIVSVEPVDQQIVRTSATTDLAAGQESDAYVSRLFSPSGSNVELQCRFSPY